LQDKDARAEPGSFGSSHAGGLSLQLQSLLKDVEAQPPEDARPSPPGQQEGSHKLWPLV